MYSNSVAFLWGVRDHPSVPRTDDLSVPMKHFLCALWALKCALLALHCRGPTSGSASVRFPGSSRSMSMKQASWLVSFRHRAQAVKREITGQSIDVPCCHDSWRLRELEHILIGPTL